MPTKPRADSTAVAEDFPASSTSMIPLRKVISLSLAYFTSEVMPLAVSATRTDCFPNTTLTL